MKETVLQVYICLRVYRYLLVERNIKRSNCIVISSTMWLVSEDRKDEKQKSLNQNDLELKEYNEAILLYETILETQGILDIIKKLAESN